MADDERLHLRESGARVGVSPQIEVPQNAFSRGGGGDGPPDAGDGRPRRLDTLDYLRAAIAATNRTRTVTITLVVASVILMIGVLNSMYHSWTGSRLLACADPDSQYVIDTIGHPPVAPLSMREQEAYKLARVRYEKRYQDLYSALTKSYADTSLAIRVPFFGFVIDANDFGLVGGLGLFIILLMFDFCVGREAENLEVGFAHAKDEASVAAFYDVLAMHQLFTLPPRSSNSTRGLTGSLPKFICCLPLLVQATIASHDYVTSGIGEELSDLHVAITFWSEMTFLVLTIGLTLAVFRQLRGIDQQWHDWAVARFPPIVKSEPQKTRLQRALVWWTS